MAKYVAVALASAVAAVGLVAGGGQAAAVSQPAATSAARGQVSVVQALPGAKVQVSVDGRTIGSDVATGKVLGPVALKAGEHTVTFTGVDGGDITTRVAVAAKSNSDVVLHQAASADARPVVHSYVAPVGPIGPGKSRLLVAHTATVAPADVRVDGTVVFDNIANGEFAESVVPSGDHEVAVFPTGAKTGALLGPLDVDLKPRTATMVYAIGSPADGSMKVISHSLELAGDGSVVPTSVRTGSAGLVKDVRVSGFVTPPARDDVTHVRSLLAVGTALLLLVVGAVVAHRRRPTTTGRGVHLPGRHAARV